MPCLTLTNETFLKYAGCVSLITLNLYTKQHLILVKIMLRKYNQKVTRRLKLNSRGSHLESANTNEINRDIHLAYTLF